MKRKNFALSPSRLFVLFAFVLISHFLLPTVFQKRDVFPFFMWDLFSKVAVPGGSFDLRIHTDRQSPESFFLQPEIRKRLKSSYTWFFIQKIGWRTLNTGHMPREQTELLLSRLREFPLQKRPLQLVQIKTYLSSHILGDTNEDSIQILGSFSTP